MPASSRSPSNIVAMWVTKTEGGGVSVLLGFFALFPFPPGARAHTHTHALLAPTLLLVPCPPRGHITKPLKLLVAQPFHTHHFLPVLVPGCVPASGPPGHHENQSRPTGIIWPLQTPLQTKCLYSPLLWSQDHPSLWGTFTTLAKGTPSSWQMQRGARAPSSVSR